MYIDTGDCDLNKAIFDALHSEKETIEPEFGEPLVWARRDDVKHSRIYVKRPGGLDDLPPELETYRAWFIEHALRFKRVFGHRLRTLDVSTAAVPVLDAAK